MIDIRRVRLILIDTVVPRVDENRVNHIVLVDTPWIDRRTYDDNAANMFRHRNNDMHGKNPTVAPTWLAIALVVGMTTGCSLGRQKTQTVSNGSDQGPTTENVASECTPRWTLSRLFARNRCLVCGFRCRCDAEVCETCVQDEEEDSTANDQSDAQQNEIAQPIQSSSGESQKSSVIQEPTVKQLIVNDDPPTPRAKKTEERRALAELDQASQEIVTTSPIPPGVSSDNPYSVAKSTEEHVDPIIESVVSDNDDAIDSNTFLVADRLPTTVAAPTPAAKPSVPTAEPTPAIKTPVTVAEPTPATDLRVVAAKEFSDYSAPSVLHEDPKTPAQPTISKPIEPNPVASTLQKPDSASSQLPEIMCEPTGQEQTEIAAAQNLKAPSNIVNQQAPKQPIDHDEIIPQSEKQPGQIVLKARPVKSDHTQDRTRSKMQSASLFIPPPPVVPLHHLRKRDPVTPIEPTQQPITDARTQDLPAANAQHSVQQDNGIQIHPLPNYSEPLQYREPNRTQSTPAGHPTTPNVDKQGSPSDEPKFIPQNFKPLPIFRSVPYRKPSVHPAKGKPVVDKVAQSDSTAETYNKARTYNKTTQRTQTNPLIEPVVQTPVRHRYDSLRLKAAPRSVETNPEITKRNLAVFRLGTSGIRTASRTDRDRIQHGGTSSFEIVPERDRRTIPSIDIERMSREIDGQSSKVGSDTQKSKTIDR